MYAIIKTGGKQYRVEKDDIIDIELLDSVADNKIEFKEVVFFSNGEDAQIGTPHLANCVVSGELLGETKGPKEIAYKYKKRKNYRRKVGHRQKYMRVKITDIAK